MFKVICFFVCLFLLFSCSVRESIYSTYQMEDGCDYLTTNSGTIITHKGTCSNVIHKCVPIVVHDTVYFVIP